MLAVRVRSESKGSVILYFPALHLRPENPVADDDHFIEAASILFDDSPRRQVVDCVAEALRDGLDRCHLVSADELVIADRHRLPAISSSSAAGQGIHCRGTAEQQQFVLRD